MRGQHAALPLRRLPLVLAVAGAGEVMAYGGHGRDRRLWTGNDTAPLAATGTSQGACFYGVRGPSLITFDEADMCSPGARGAAAHAPQAVQGGTTLELPLVNLLIPGEPVLRPNGEPLLHRSGLFVGRPVVFGEVFSELGRSLPSATEFAAKNVDFFSLFQRDGRLFSVQNFEGFLASMYITEFDAARQQKDGSLVPVDVQAIRLHDPIGAVGGHVHCSGSVTPWSSHLASEEFAAPGDWIALGEPGEKTSAQLQFFDGGSASNNTFHIYRYGYPVEVQIRSEDPHGTLGRIGASGYYSAERHYAMGRISHEVPLCLPDKVTCYLSDDWPAGVFMSFRASRPGDLSEGELLAARARQGASLAGAVNMTLELEWISLGVASDGEISPHLGLAYEDLIWSVAPLADATCPSGFTSTNSRPAFGGHECLRVLPGMGTIASRLETRRVAAMLGASQEFSRVEGLTYDSKRNYLYAAFTKVEFAALDNALAGFDAGGPNDIRWPPNPCGCVVAIALDAQLRATALWPIVCGEARWRKTGTAEKPAAMYCAHDSLANPDNVAYSPDADGLLIAEDSDLHARNVLWLLRLGDGLDLSPGAAQPSLSKRHLTALYVAPEGAEVSSPGYYSNLNGFAYMTLAAAHPSAGDPHPAILGPLRKCCNTSVVSNAPDDCPMESALVSLVDKPHQDLLQQTETLRRRQRELDDMQEARLRSTIEWLGSTSEPHPEEFLTCSVGLLPQESRDECMRRKLA